MTKTLKLSLLLIIAINTFTFSQDKFIYDLNGLNPKFIVVEMDSLNKSELYKSTINWIKETYKNPDEVIKMTIENEKLRFEGFQDNLICVNSIGMIYCYYALYTIEIEFKDNKYKFTPLSLDYRVPASQYSSGGMTPVNFSDGSGYYNKRNELRKMYKTIPLAIENLFNDLSANLTTYLKSSNEVKETDGW